MITLRLLTTFIDGMNVADVPLIIVPMVANAKMSGRKHGLTKNEMKKLNNVKK